MCVTLHRALRSINKNSTRTLIRSSQSVGTVTWVRFPPTGKMTAMIHLCPSWHLTNKHLSRWLDSSRVYEMINTYGTWFIDTCDISRLNEFLEGYTLFVSPETSISRMCTCATCQWLRVRPLNHLCVRCNSFEHEITYFHVCHESIMCNILIRICDMRLIHVRAKLLDYFLWSNSRNINQCAICSLVHVTWRIRQNLHFVLWPLKHLSLTSVWQDSFICVPWLIHTWHSTQVFTLKCLSLTCVWYESYIPVINLIHLCFMTHSNL